MIRVSRLLALLLAGGVLLPGLGAKPVAPESVVARAAAEAPTYAPTLSTAEDAPAAGVQFDAITFPLPPNLPSLDFDTTGTREFGDLVRLAGHAHYIDSVTVAMSSWAIRSDYPGASPLGFSHPLTLRLYAVDRSSGAPQPGGVLAEVTQVFLIPWRPEPVPGEALRAWHATDGRAYTGIVFNVTFPLDRVARALPDEVIVAVSFNTEHGGPRPLGAPGPYNALHLALTDRTPRVGADVAPDAVFWNTTATSSGALYADAGWGPYRPAIRVNGSAYGQLADMAAQLRGIHSNDPRRELSWRAAATLLSLALVRVQWDGNSRLAADFDYGALVFELLADATGELARLASSPDPGAATAAHAVEIVLGAAQELAEAALGDALIGAGRATDISEADAALDAALAEGAAMHFDRAIDRFGEAWTAAQTSLW